MNFTVCLCLAVVPRVEVSPKNVTKMQGSNVKAVCTATGSPLPEILWNLDLLSSHHEVSQSTSWFKKKEVLSEPEKIMLSLGVWLKFQTYICDLQLDDFSYGQQYYERTKTKLTLPTSVCIQTLV